MAASLSLDSARPAKWPSSCSAMVCTSFPLSRAQFMLLVPMEMVSLNTMDASVMWREGWLGLYIIHICLAFPLARIQGASVIEAWLVRVIQDLCRLLSK